MASERTKLGNLSLDVLRSERASAVDELTRETARLAPFRARLDAIDAELKARSAAALEAARTSKPEGVVRFTVDGVEIEADRSKTVKWDQKVLVPLAQKMAAAGGKLADWGIVTEFKISEERWKNWPDDMRKFFETARELKLGDNKVAFAEPKEKSKAA